MEQQIKTYLNYSQACLMNPANIEPKGLATYFATYTYYGVNDHIASLVQQYFFVNLHHPLKLRYIHLLDQLIKYSFPLPHSFVKMFVICFHQSLQNREHTIQEDLKILYKIWSVMLNENVIDDIRSQIYRNNKIDIQYSISSQSKKFLHKYFSTDMSLPFEEINFILYSKKNPIRNSDMNKSYQRSQRSNAHFKQLQQMGKTKKKVKLTQEIETSTTSNDIQIFSKSQNALQILNKLRALSNFCCKQCGRHFQSKQSYENHKQAHFKQKMENLKQKQRKKTIKWNNNSRKTQRKELSINQWLVDKQFEDQLKNSNVTVQIGHELEFNKECTICGCQFDIKIVNDLFVYENTIKVQLASCENQKQKQIDIVHTHCYQMLIPLSIK